MALVYSGLLSFAPNFFNVAYITWASPQVWLQIALVPLVCIAIDLVWHYLQKEFAPSCIDLGVEENR